MSEFDGKCLDFTRACQEASHWKHNYLGVAYRTRIDAAFRRVQEAYVALCVADAEEKKPCLSG